MAYKEITGRTSPNKWVGGNTIKGLTIHWWGDPKTNPTAEGVVNWLCNPASQVSAHFVITGTGRKVWQLVADKDRAWHAMAGNHSTLGLELDPRCRDSDYDVAAEVIADLWRYYGKLPLYPHKHWVATACPGNYDLKRLQREAEAKLNPPKPAPKPVKETKPAGGVMKTNLTSAQWQSFIKRVYQGFNGSNPKQSEIDFHMANSNPLSFVNGFKSFKWQSLDKDVASLKKDKAALQTQVKDLNTALKKAQAQLDKDSNHVPADMQKEIDRLKAENAKLIQQAQSTTDEINNAYYLLGGWLAKVIKTITRGK